MIHAWRGHSVHGRAWCGLHGGVTARAEYHNTKVPERYRLGEPRPGVSHATAKKRCTMNDTHRCSRIDISIMLGQPTNSLAMTFLGRSVDRCHAFLNTFAAAVRSCKEPTYAVRTLLAMLISAVCSAKQHTISRCPFLAATNTGVEPICAQLAQRLIGEVVK